MGPPPQPTVRVAGVTCASVSVVASAQREQVDALHAVATRRAFLGGPAKGIEVCRDAGVSEPRGRKRLDELCFQQGAGNSTRPEIDISERAVGQ
jgi:hypothetical protein